VAIIVAIVITLLILIVGLVVDLGFLYTRKTALQNAADAAALAGAKKLDGTTAGIQAAADAAIAMAALNSVNFGKDDIVIGYESIGFGSTPDDCIPLSNPACADLTEAKANPGNKFFITVDTSTTLQGLHPTWFMRLAGFEETNTYGRAVAGPFVVDITPIAACALDGSDVPPLPASCKTDNCGYELGKSYKIGDINPIGPGTFYWIDPVTTIPGECGGSGSTSETLPFVCRGEVAANVAISEQVLTNTGVSTPQLEALDSRFDSYGSQAKCDPATAPPDENIKEYLYTNYPDLTVSWMNPAPTKQASTVTSKTGIPPVIDTDYNGVFWTFVRPPADIPVTTDFATGRTAILGNYAEADKTPYTSSQTKFREEPTHDGEPGRRVLNMLIVRCPSEGGNCRETPVFAIGRFLMQRKANVPGDKDIYVEFGGIIQRPPDVEVKLYR
jgi:Flp pilus assembly protein TadG